MLNDEDRASFDRLLADLSRFRRSCTTVQLAYTILCLCLLTQQLCTASRLDDGLFGTNGNGVHSSTNDCQVELCASQFTDEMERDKVLVSANIRYCLLMNDYRDCLQSTSRQCRGVLKYHSLTTLLRKQRQQYDCDEVIKSRDAAAAIDASGNVNGCVFPYEQERGAANYRVCQLFGDPHLRTFDGQLSTCATKGAWPLVDNAYFAVQITNEHVNANLSVATFISKITVLIKQLRGCTGQKRYGAGGDDARLPAAFDDGTRFSGGSRHLAALELVADEHYERGYHPGVTGGGLSERVEIRLRYIASRIVIRRHGRHLAVTVKMPEQIVAEKTTIETGQLCVSGCPARETLPLKEALAAPHRFVACYGQGEAPRLLYDRNEALRICGDAQLSDFYLDACVFDVMLSGDRALAAAAATALTDIHMLYAPYRRHYQLNRTDLSIYEHLANSATFGARKCRHFGVSDHESVGRALPSSNSLGRFTYSFNMLFVCCSLTLLTSSVL